LGDGGEEDLTGHTIDHLVATIAFIAAMFLFLGLFTQTLQGAILYQQNRHVALKASDLLDNILLSPGYPYHWGERNTTLSCFGLQQPGAVGYALSSFALMRLMSVSGDLVEYPEDSDIWYSNVSWGSGGGYLLMPVSESVNYATASRLLGVNGSYGFQLSVTPTLRINITETQSNPLRFEVKVEGLGFPLSGATVTYLLYWVYLDEDDQRFFNVTSGNTQTDSVGEVSLEFSANPYVDGRTAYTIIVYADLSGLYGVGYRTRETITRAGNIIPFVESYENGTILLAHKWGKNDPESSVAALHFDATFFVMSDDFELSRIQDWTGLVNYGTGKPYYRIQIPTSSMGFLIVTYWTGDQYGMIIMPWGISVLGFSVLFGGNPAGNVWVATDLRQVTVSQMAYQAKIACWSLRGYQTSKPSGRW